MSPTASNKRKAFSTLQWTLDQASDLHNPQWSKKSYYRLLLCLIETCRHRQADCCICKQQGNTRNSLWYSWYLLTASKVMMVFYLTWSWPLWLICSLSPSCSSKHDLMWPRFSFNYFLHVLPLCDILTPTAAGRIRPISDHAKPALYLFMYACAACVFKDTVPAVWRLCCENHAPRFLSAPVLQLPTFLHLKVTVRLTSGRGSSRSQE